MNKETKKGTHVNTRPTNTEAQDNKKLLRIWVKPVFERESLKEALIKSVLAGPDSEGSAS